MHHIKVIAAALILLSAISCGKDQPRTPAEAFQKAAAAVEKKDGARLYNLLSAPSRESVLKTAKLAAMMKDGQKRTLAEKNALPSGKIDTESLINTWLERDSQTDPVLGAFRRPILMIEEKDGTAKVRLDNGIELKFVREGLYWKFAL
jgi:hypothetical protein